jgi:hypothetical protein
MSIIPNFYESPALVGSGLIYRDPLEDAHERAVGFGLNSRACVVGRSGSGKSNWLMWYLSRVCTAEKPIFNGIYISYSVSEPLYEYLVSDKGIGPDNCILIQGLAKFPSVHDFPSAQSYVKKTARDPLGRKMKPDIKHYCVVFDDVVSADKLRGEMLEKVSQFWRQGRKHNCTCIILSQMYSAIPKFIRVNSSLLVLASLQGRDKRYVLSETNLSDYPPEQVMAMYEFCSTPRSPSEKPVMMVTMGHVTNKNRVVRRGFDEWLNPDDFYVPPPTKTRAIRNARRNGDDEEDNEG